jgi:phospholipid/cholesterol/gamma-HCH transport system substrate-binding protein
MENKAHALLAGLFALLLSLGLLAALWWMGGDHTEQAEYRIASEIPVSWLNPQAAVRYRGVTVGRVENIALDPQNPNRILIDIAVDASLKLNRDTYAKLASQGLTGLAYIEIDSPGADPKALGDKLIPLRQSGMSEMMDAGMDIMEKTGKLEDNADKLLTSLNRLLTEDNTQKIGRLLENMERSSAALEPLLKSSQHTSEKAGKLLDEIKPHELSATLDALRQASLSARETAETAQPTLLQVQKSLAEFERIGRRIEAVTADVGENINYETLPRIHELAHQLNRDAQSLNRLMETLEQHPQSAIFGKPIAQPGPGEKGFQP